MYVRQQHKVIGKVKVLQRINECPSHPSMLLLMHDYLLLFDQSTSRTWVSYPVFLLAFFPLLSTGCQNILHWLALSNNLRQILNFESKKKKKKKSNCASYWCNGLQSLHQILKCACNRLAVVCFKEHWITWSERKVLTDLSFTGHRDNGQVGDRHVAVSAWHPDLVLHILLFPAAQQVTNRFVVDLQKWSGKCVLWQNEGKQLLPMESNPRPQ